MEDAGYIADLVLFHLSEVAPVRFAILIQEPTIERARRRSDHEGYSFPPQVTDGVRPVNSRWIVGSEEDCRQQHYQCAAKSSRHQEEWVRNAKDPFAKSNKWQPHECPADRKKRSSPDTPRSDCTGSVDEEAEDDSGNQPANPQRFERASEPTREGRPHELIARTSCWRSLAIPRRKLSRTLHSGFRIDRRSRLRVPRRACVPTDYGKFDAPLVQLCVSF